MASGPACGRRRNSLMWRRRGEFCDRELISPEIDAAPRPPLRHRFTHFDFEMTPLHTRCAGMRPAVGEERQSLWYHTRATAPIGLPAPIAMLLQVNRARPDPDDRAFRWLAAAGERGGGRGCGGELLAQRPAQDLADVGLRQLARESRSRAVVCSRSDADGHSRAAPAPSALHPCAPRTALPLRPSTHRAAPRRRPRARRDSLAMTSSISFGIDLEPRHDDHVLLAVFDEHEAALHRDGRCHRCAASPPAASPWRSRRGVASSPA